MPGNQIASRFSEAGTLPVITSAVSMPVIHLAMILPYDHDLPFSQSGKGLEPAVSKLSAGVLGTESAAESSGNLVYAGYPYDPYK